LTGALKMATERRGGKSFRIKGSVPLGEVSHNFACLQVGPIQLDHCADITIGGQHKDDATDGVDLQCAEWGESSGMTG
jgi:hypothetical protein